MFGCNIVYYFMKFGMLDVVVFEWDKFIFGMIWYVVGEIVFVVLGSEWECEFYIYGWNLIVGFEEEIG